MRLKVPGSAGFETWASQLQRSLLPAASFAAGFQDLLDHVHEPIKQLLQSLEESVPENIRGSDLTDRAADLMLDEGLPLWGVPNREIIAELIDAADGDTRLALLWQRRAEVLEDCEDLIGDRTDRVALLVMRAIEALREGHSEAAQCLATNLVDEVVERLFGDAEGQSASAAAQRFAKEDYMDKPIRLTGDYLALRPIVLAWTQWRPTWGTPPPDRYSRHVTVHRPTAESVFGAPRPLIAVMLAVTLAVRFPLQPSTT